MGHEIEALSVKYGITSAFMANYFYKNSFERFINKVQGFMLWRQGSFLPPHKKEQYIQEYMAEEIVDYYEKKIVRIPTVQFSLTTRCTLKCRDCAAMAPLFGKDGINHIDMTFDQFKHNLDSILNGVDYIRSIQLLGGEPLLNKELPQMVSYAAAKEKIGLVDIVTNCTLVPSPELLDAAGQYSHKVFFGLSNYSSNPGLASLLKRAEIIKVLQENNIKHTPDTGEAPWWRYELKVCDYTTEQMHSIFSSCQWHHCLYVLDGILAVCPRSLIGKTLGAFTLLDDEMVDLCKEGIKDNMQMLVLSLFKRDYISACRYCLQHSEKISPAIQL